MALAKGLGGGFPIGAVVATEAVARNMRPGTHGTTFGGNPLACAAGNAVLDVLLAPGFLDQVTERSTLLRAELAKLAAEFPHVIEDIRGRGLLIGLKLGSVTNSALQAACLEQGLMVVAAGDNVVRLVPPLVITPEDCLAAVSLLRRAVTDLAETKMAAQ
jgi:acetylornithine/N-succinyldiaminopimelate aminotransferase